MIGLVGYFLVDQINYVRIARVSNTTPGFHLGRDDGMEFIK